MSSESTEIEQENEGVVKPFADQVIDLYESCLQSALIISTSFKGVIEQKLDNKKRWMQFCFLFALIGYSVPRHAILSFLYLKDKETRKSWEFFLPNYFEELGLFGKVLNFAYAVFGLLIFVDLIHLRSFEAKGRVDYLTHMETLRWKEKTFQDIEVDQNEIETLGQQEKEKLLKGMKMRLLILKNSSLLMFWSTYMYHLVPCPLFLYKERPHVVTSILAITNVLIMYPFLYYSDNFMLNIYTSYVITVDYFSARIQFMMKGLKEEVPTEKKMNRVLLQYNLLMMDFMNQDYLLKYLLRNMMYGYSAGLTNLFLMFTADMNPFVRVVLLTAIAIIAITMLSSGLYVGRLHSMTMALYGELNSMAARNCQGIKSVKSFKTLKTRRDLLNCIKELGSQQTDGQYVMGLRDGHGAVVSSLEMFHLTMAIISNTLMVMDFMYN